MVYVKIKDNVVIQKQPNDAPGFVEVDEDVVCGQIKQGNVFVNPPPEPKGWKKLREDKYKDKGWESSFDLIDDILDRGLDAVKADRDAIKAAHPEV